MGKRGRTRGSAAEFTTVDADQVPTFAEQGSAMSRPFASLSTGEVVHAEVVTPEHGAPGATSSPGDSLLDALAASTAARSGIPSALRESTRIDAARSAREVAGQLRANLDLAARGDHQSERVSVCLTLATQLERVLRQL